MVGICIAIASELNLGLTPYPGAGFAIPANRATTVARQLIERGQVVLPRGRAYSTVLVDEAAQFPHGLHDDMIDTMVMAIEYLMPKGWVWDADQKRRSAAAPPSNNVELLQKQLRDAVRRKIQDNARSNEDQGSPWHGGM